MIEKIIGCALEGIESHKVEVEVNISRGAKFLLVGLPDNAVKESHFRIVAALKNIGYKNWYICIFCQAYCSKIHDMQIFTYNFII